MPDDPAAVPVTRVNTAVTGGRYELPVYPYVEPAELKGKLGRHPVVIVGAGLAGLAAACDFSLRGIPAVVLDEDDTVGVRGASSRAICYARKSLEYFRRLGVYERVAAKGVPWSVARSYAGAQEIDRIDFADAPGAESCQPPFVNLQQFYVEWFLVDRIYELAVVDLRWKTRVIGVTAHPDHVEVHVETPSGRYTLDTGWLIDCSGGRSAVPGWLGSPAAASDVLDRWCVCDVRLPEPPPPERRCWIEAPFNDGNSAWQQPMADGVARFDYQLPATVDPVAASSVEAIGQRLQRQFGSAAERAELIWIGAYEYRSRCLQQFRRGRTLFAGDAAHLMSPFGARGGSAALQDAENLVWKLALVLQGRAPEALLASYEDERRPAALEDIRATEATARFLAPRSAAERELRAAVLAQARGGGFARELINPGRMSVPYAYDRSMLSLDGRPCRTLRSRWPMVAKAISWRCSCSWISRCSAWCAARYRPGSPPSSRWRCPSATRCVSCCCTWALARRPMGCR